ncbi:hypothetical protein SAMN04488057_11815 [Cyclobacterium lianum]|uniref:DUF5675 domain-containing protein n=1 Tax=Cyclobacterium lianum TaxID=388280 RepID=A0A1M7QGZ1_9BACT|nr:DUF5675 family protein [Cyclobacterium lianum]SHN30278.1 hypothetical protein SAMN04488057_11815 [Cyclobacterium lianum]
MKRFTGLVLIALVLLAIAFFIYNPEILGEIWMWLVGLIGYLIYFFNKAADTLKNAFKTPEPDTAQSKDEQKSSGTDTLLTKLSKNEPDIEGLENLLAKSQPQMDSLSQENLTLLRYMDDGYTTLGLLFIEGQFFAYTLEDTHRDEKVSGNTRIPAGRYPLSYNRNLTDLTRRYRNRFPWFEYHIEIMDIPNYDLVYIHIGNTHQDTRGCILLADGVNAASPEKMVSYSRKAYERFYRSIYPRVKANIPLAIRIFDENWIKMAKIKANEAHALPQN